MERERFDAVCRGFDIAAEPFENADPDFEVYRIVLDQQHAHPGRAIDRRLDPRARCHRGGAGLDQPEMRAQHR
jgi:hypothetical protein